MLCVWEKASSKLCMESATWSVAQTDPNIIESPSSWEKSHQVEQFGGWEKIPSCNESDSVLTPLRARKATSGKGFPVAGMATFAPWRENSSAPRSKWEICMNFIYFIWTIWEITWLHATAHDLDLPWKAITCMQCQRTDQKPSYAVVPCGQLDSTCHVLNCKFYNNTFVDRSHQWDSRGSIWPGDGLPSTIRWTDVRYAGPAIRACL